MVLFSQIRQSCKEFWFHSIVQARLYKYGSTEHLFIVKSIKHFKIAKIGVSLNGLFEKSPRYIKFFIGTGRPTGVQHQHPLTLQLLFYMKHRPKHLF